MNLNLNFNQTTPLCEIMTRNRSDKGNSNLQWAWHHYTMFYYELWKNIKDKKLRVFELGMGTTDPNIDSNMGPNGRPGASLFGWCEFFANSEIYGADVDKKILFETDRIKTYYCDQTDAECVRNMWLQPGLEDNFDIIIDDGLHRYFSNECFFENSIHKLKPDGYYIIEDINNKRDLQQLLEIVEKWKTIYTEFNFELIKFPSHWNDYDNNVMLITKKREFQQQQQQQQQTKNEEVISMLNESLIISYSTPNYEKLTSLYLNSLKNIGVKEENIKHKLDNYDNSIFTNEGFQTNLWYYAVTNKIKHLITVLENYKLTESKKYFIFSDCDIVFINKNREKWTQLQEFVDKNDNDIFFMREHTSELVNTGFFIIKNNKNIKYIITFFKNVLFNLLNREKRTMELGDQTIINEMLHNINYDFIPNEYIVYGRTIFNINQSLVHHAVYCKTIDEKLEQINFIKTFFE
jgi:SAM-dependent methyltransferase